MNQGPSVQGFRVTERTRTNITAQFQYSFIVFGSVRQ